MSDYIILEMGNCFWLTTQEAHDAGNGPLTVFATREKAERWLSKLQNATPLSMGTGQVRKQS